MDLIVLQRRRIALRFRVARAFVMFGLIVAVSNMPPDFAGGDGFRMASALPRSTHCLVGGGGEGPGQAACVRTVAAGFTSVGEPAAGVLFATLALAPASRRKRPASLVPLCAPGRRRVTR